MSLEHRLTRTLLASTFVVIGGLVAPLQAQVDEPGWDLSDPANQADTHEFFSRVWAAQEAGTDIAAALEGFEWTNDPPRDTRTLVLPAIELFEELYADQLDPSVWNGYSIEDLLRDDPNVFGKFKDYVLGGMLSTSASAEPDAFNHHVDVILEALSGSGDAQLSGEVSIVGDSIESEGLTVVAGGGGGDATSEAAAPVEDDFRDLLRCLVNQSLLACMSDEGLYWPSTDSPEHKDYPLTEPDFDCDDFARAMAAWLHHRLQDDMNIPLPGSGGDGNMIRYIGINWSCPVLGPDGQPVHDSDGNEKRVDHGHALVLIRVTSPPPTKYYVIDPQSERLLGPLTEDPDSESFWQKILDQLQDSYSTCNGKRRLKWPTDGRKPNWEPSDYPGLVENPIWWRDRDLQDTDDQKNNPDKDMWKRFRDKLQACCSAHPPEACGTGPHASTPCDDPEKYIW